MKDIQKYIGSIILALIAGVSPTMIKGADFHCEQDTAKVMTILRECYNPGGDPAAVVSHIAESFVETPTANVTMSDSTWQPTINVHAFDDMNFLTMVTAMSRLSTSPGHKRSVELRKELENIGYRRGEYSGSASRMVYLSDWVVDNKSRGIVKELTESYSDAFRTKSLDKVTRERDKYVILQDSSALEGMKMMEMGFRTHKVPHLKREQASSKEVLEEMRDGDIIVLLTPDNSTDALEIGFVKKEEDGFYFIHPSVERGRVIMETENLSRYIKRNAKRIYGWRWLRLAK